MRINNKKMLTINESSYKFSRLIIVFLATLFLSGIFFNESLFAFYPEYHKEITKEILKKFDFEDDIAQEVSKFNSWTDTFEFSYEEAHADNNKLYLASERIINKEKEILQFW